MTFTYLFYKHIIFRHSCGVCHYTNLQRPSDITLADYWGWQETVPDMNTDDKGISLILTNTIKGEKLLQAVKDKLTIEDVPLEKAMQPQLKAPSPIDKNRDAFEKYYVENGFVASMKKYGDFNLSYRLGKTKRKLAKLLVRIANKIKRVLNKRIV